MNKCLSYNPRVVVMATIENKQNHCLYIRIVDYSTNWKNRHRRTFGVSAETWNQNKPLMPRGHKNRAHPTLLPQMQVTPDNLDKVLFPLCRTEHRSFWRDQPAGERQGCRSFSEGQEPLPKTLGKSEERRIKAASGSPFLWILSFGDAKESIAVAGPRTGVKLGFAIAKH
jgi:hypothetical protein